MLKRKRDGWRNIPLDSPRKNLLEGSGDKELIIPLRRDNQVVINIPEVFEPGGSNIDDTTPVSPQFEPVGDKPEKKQTKSTTLDDLLDMQDVILEGILSHEADDKIGLLCVCEKDVANFRCRDCSVPMVMCSNCIVHYHRSNPFHLVAEWNGSFFVKTTLASLGMVLYLRHKTNICPEKGPRSVSDVTLVHVNGIQPIKIAYCGCPGYVGEAAQMKQLTEHGLFPASVKRPRTLFTHKLLRDFHVDTTCSKTSAYDYIRKIERITDRVFVDSIPSRYREFLVIERAWRYIQAQKRSGQALGISKWLPDFLHGQTTVVCPSCPIPGVNIPEEPKSLPIGKRHINTLFLHMDGNFQLDRKQANGEGEYDGLTDGTAYFPKREEFKGYLASVTSEPIPRTCNVFKVLEELRRIKGGVDVSGVLSVFCRHGLFRGKGTVDLQKGERFANADYALYGAIEGTDGLRTVVSYDIACQYIINILKRFKKNFPDRYELVSKINFLIPKLHLMSHKTRCQLLYSFNYSPETGRTHGEVPEQGWWIANEAAASTREMNPGRRHDTLNDQISSVNLDKVVNMSNVLELKLREAQQQRARWCTDFELLTQAHDPSKIEQWKKLDRLPVLTGTDGVESVYKMSSRNIPSQRDILDQLKKHETSDQRSEESAMSGGMVEFINKGLILERLRVRVTAFLTQDEGPKLKERFMTQYATWDKMRQIYITVLPKKLQLQDDHPGNSQPNSRRNSSTIENNVELPKVILPSMFTEEERSVMGLERLAKIESKLRRGFMEDTLNDLRIMLRRKALLYAARRTKRANSGKTAWTRTQTKIEKAGVMIVGLATTYRECRSMVHRLDGKFPTMFPVLKDKDLTIPHVQNNLQLGRGYTNIGWLWYMQRKSSSSKDNMDAWTTEADSVQWFEAQAEAERWIEEVETLEAEQERCHIYFGFYAQIWKNLAKAENGSTTGATAYASRIANIFERLRRKVKLPEKNEVRSSGLHQET